MRKKLFQCFKRNEIYVVSSVIAVVFVVAMGLVAWMLRSSLVEFKYAALSKQDLRKVYATGYLRFREDDGSPYLKIELHNGTLWWIKRIEFEFDGAHYKLGDAQAFRPMQFGAVRCMLNRTPTATPGEEYDLRVLKASGYPPAEMKILEKPSKIARQSDRAIGSE